MAGSLLAILSAAALAVLIVPHAAETTCTFLEKQEAGIDFQQQWRDPCFTSWCHRFPFARCETQKCTARFFVGSTDVTDHCDVDNCVVENSPDIECNGLCGIDFLTGRPYCDPSCDFDNGGCSDDEVCVPDRIFCIRAPCPQGIRCIHKTAVCNQEPDTDLCGIAEKAFFYNPATQLCQRFVYGGCERTHNRFSTMRECRETCRGVTDVCSTSIRCPPGTRCKINDNGIPFCEASCEYDSGGCEVDETCRMRQPQCLTVPCPDFVQCLPRREVCTLDADVGDCKAAIPRYYHNQQSGRCERFSYGGCGGNENRFVTLEECQEACGVESPCNLIDCAPGAICHVDTDGDAECVSITSCLIRSCPTGFSCERDPSTNMAECVPIFITIDPCIATLCAVGTICEVDPTGSPVCVPVPHPCATIECRKPDICRVRPSTQIGYCGVDPCIAMNCGKNYECSYNEKTDEGECVPTAPCLLQDCPTGQVCKLNEDTGEGVCSPPDLRCMIFDCPKGTVCQPKKGIRTTVECVPEHSCSHINCGSQLCRIDQVSGRGYCGIDPCTLVRCFNCRYNPETDGPQCMGDPCATVRCSEGTTCRVDENGEPECVSPCEDIICGSLMCRVNPDTNTGYCGLDPCTYTTCEAGTQCRFNMKLDAAECVAVDPCSTMDCAEGTTCQVDASTGEAQCVLDLPDIRCFLLQCAAGFVCQANEDGSVECVQEDPCSGRNCGQLMCRVRPDTRRAYCGLDPCTFTNCREGTECRYNPDLDTAVCVNPTDPCDGFSCTGGDICRVNLATGLPFCGITPCAFTTCFVNTVCIYDPTTDAAKCIAPPDPCDGFRCNGGDICRVNLATGLPFCDITPCAFTTCFVNTVCIYDPTTDAARCVAPPDPCDGFRCNGGDICRVNQATQEPFCGIDLCTIISCAPHTRCNHDPLTDIVTCEQVISPLPDACTNVQCAPWTRCEVNERSVAECVSICSDILCGRPLVCRVNATTQEPYCGHFPCRNFRCVVPGTECQYDYETDGPRCSFVDNSPGDVCNPDPCPFDFECVRNTRGNAECLLLTIG